MKYNFGFRVGNEDQNALRFGLESGPFFLNVGNSYRRPTLYELHGDGWVDGADVGLLLVDWGKEGDCLAADLNGDQVVDGADFGLLLAAWGEYP